MTNRLPRLAIAGLSLLALAPIAQAAPYEFHVPMAGLMSQQDREAQKCLQERQWTETETTYTTEYRESTVWSEWGTALVSQNVGGPTWGFWIYSGYTHIHVGYNTPAYRVPHEVTEGEQFAFEHPTNGYAYETVVRSCGTYRGDCSMNYRRRNLHEAYQVPHEEEVFRKTDDYDWCVANGYPTGA